MSDEPTDLGNRLGEPTRIGDLLHLVARTDERTDGLTKKDSPPADPSSNATPAGGQSESTENEGHTHTPHVYVVYWPDLYVLKVGISTAIRWNAWASRGGVEIAASEVCCTDHARSVEKWLHGILRKWCLPAFRNGSEGSVALGPNGGGWTECFRTIPAKRRDWPMEHAWDYESRYGLILPPEFEKALEEANFAFKKIHDFCDHGLSSSVGAV